MEAITFKEVNLELAKDQEQYQTLPVHYDDTIPEGPMTACFKLTPEEIKQIILTGKLWHTQWTFKKGFQPVAMSTSNPFEGQVDELDPETMKRLIPVAMQILINSWKQDKEPGSYYHAWQSNIAMAFYDQIGQALFDINGDKVEILEAANKAAANFIDHLIANDENKIVNLLQEAANNQTN